MHTLEQVEKQLNRLVEVLKVTDHAEPHVERELGLGQGPAWPGWRSASRSRTSQEAFRARVVDVAQRSPSSSSSPATPSRSDSFIEALRPYGLLEVMRTGAVAMSTRRASTQGAREKSRLGEGRPRRAE
jgi:acetolactate synthase-1/3 small subunit